MIIPKPAKHPLVAFPTCRGYPIRVSLWSTLSDGTAVSAKRFSPPPPPLAWRLEVPIGAYRPWCSWCFRPCSSSLRVTLAVVVAGRVMARTLSCLFPPLAGLLFDFLVLRQCLFKWAYSLQPWHCMSLIYRFPIATPPYFTLSWSSRERLPTYMLFVVVFISSSPNIRSP